MSVILEALAVAVGKPQTDIQDVENVERFGEMLEGCRSTLNRIEYIVDKYSDRIGPGWKWKNWFSKGYKLIRWTADGGDIKSLKTELRRHHNLIDAYVNILQRWEGNNLPQQEIALLILLKGRFAAGFGCSGAHAWGICASAAKFGIQTSATNKTQCP